MEIQGCIKTLFPKGEFFLKTPNGDELSPKAGMVE